MRAAPKRIRTPEHYATLRANRKAAYYDRKMRQVCIDCEAQLEPGDGARCSLCEANDRDRKAVYNLTSESRASHRKAMIKMRAKRKAADQCIMCRLHRSEWPARIPPKRSKLKQPRQSEICPSCRKKQTDAQRDYRTRKKLGIIPIAAERRKQRIARLRERRGDTYEPIDEQLADPRGRILRALRHHEWIACVDLFAQLGVPESDRGKGRNGDNRERDRYTALLSRLTKAGLLERRRIPIEGHAFFEYQLTPRARAQCGS